MAEGLHLTIISLDSELLDQDGATEYRSIVGALIHISHFRPDIMYAMGTLTHFMSRPGEPHMTFLIASEKIIVSGRNTTHVDPYGDTLAAATNFQGGHFAKLQHDHVVRAVARFATNPGSMRTEEALLRVRAATVDIYVELDQPDGQAAVGHIVEMKTVHYGLTHYNA
ncbi:hypothetical protein T492DRAFT_886552, partial [Pavlovales sp. CCMP2436]